MEPILLLIVGAAIGLAIGLMAATMVARRRGATRAAAVEAELLAARQRAERAAAEAQAIHTRLLTAEVLAAHAAELQTALEAARAELEWHAAHVAALEGELTTLRGGRRPGHLGPTAGPAGIGPAAAAASRGGSSRSALPADARPARRPRPETADLGGREGSAGAPFPVAPEADRRSTAGGATTPTAGAHAVLSPSVLEPATATPATPDAVPDPPWMAEAAAAAAATDAAERLAHEPVTDRPARASRTRATVEPTPFAPTTRGAAPAVAVGAAPGSPPVPRPRRSTTSDPAAGGTARPSPATPPAVTAEAADPTTSPGLAAPPLPAPSPEPVAIPVAPPAPHPQGWVAVRPGLSDPWSWLGTRSPGGVAYEEDDLQAIHGIGPYLARRLREEGILTWRQMVDWDEEDMALVSRRIGTFPDRIRREDWPASARALHEARYRETLP